MIGRLKVYAALIGLFITTLAATWFGGKMTGAANVKAKQAERRLRAVKEAGEIENEVEALDADTLKRRSAKWVRNSKR
jgi:hypothetical protein